jgi:aryl-phospho-beta-D-glucosidase BglC (GH1 family)
MRISPALAAALLASSANAAPVADPGLITNILGGVLGGVNTIVGGVFKDLNSLLNGLGIKLHTDASKHGPTVPFHQQCPFDINPVDNKHPKNSHDINWGKGVYGNDYMNWKTFKANGANLGGWLEKEQTHDPVWWNEVGGEGVPDEWSLCQKLGSQCGPVFEARYASFLNTSSIDKLASVGVNTLRIPLTYAPFVKVPGSQLYRGNQLKYLKTITDYAVRTHGMHIILGLHSLPGGVNNLDIGEALFHNDWFQNATNLDFSLQAVDGALNFIKNSGYANAFTFAPLNEASDNFAGFGSAAGLTANGTNWINTYFDGVLKKIAKVDSRIPMMIQDSFMGTSYWSPFYDASQNIVFDTHIYYFAAAGTYANYVNPAVCGQGAYVASDTKFPIFVGEWSLQAMYNNTFDARKTLFDTQRYAWQKYVSGGSFWTAVSYANGKVDGEGEVSDYWSFIKLIDAGVITKETKEAYC